MCAKWHNRIPTKHPNKQQKLLRSCGCFNGISRVFQMWFKRVQQVHKGRSRVFCQTHFCIGLLWRTTVKKVNSLTYYKHSRKLLIIESTPSNWYNKLNLIILFCLANYFHNLSLDELRIRLTHMVNGLSLAKLKAE